MRITINPTLNLETMEWLPSLSYEYCGPVLRFKGDDAAKSAEFAQLGFDKQLMDIFGQQYGKQSAIFDFLTGKMKSAVATGGMGYRPDFLAAARTEASDVNAQQTKNAEQAFANSVAARSGGSKLAGVAGATAAGEATIGAAGAAQEATSQNAITMANENQRLQNYWNSVNVLTGQQAVANPLGYSQGATSGTNAVANASEAVTAAQGPSAGQIIGGLVGGGISAAGTALGGGSLGKLFGK
jgi:hypothetical protein